ncbi:MAG: hypothetical protein MZV64_59220 [Ignavibacteriales bacterium]|nr:hypothetical protein [Ignavibacteriales bacterium]
MRIHRGRDRHQGRHCPSRLIPCRLASSVKLSSVSETRSLSDAWSRLSGKPPASSCAIWKRSSINAESDTYIALCRVADNASPFRDHPPRHQTALRESRASNASGVCRSWLDPGDQVAAQAFEFALLLVGGLQLLRHLVEGTRQRRPLHPVPCTGTRVFKSPLASCSAASFNR